MSRVAIMKRLEALGPAPFVADSRRDAKTMHVRGAVH